VTHDEINEALNRLPEPIDPKRWASMDPEIRLRFHELANHISRLEGIITGLSLRTPDKPETIPLLKQQVRGIEASQTELKQEVATVRTELGSKIDDVKDDVNGLALKVAGGTALVTGIVTAIVQLATGSA
jgi:hypothetical protein